MGESEVYLMPVSQTDNNEIFVSQHASLVHESDWMFGLSGTIMNPPRNCTESYLQIFRAPGPA